MSSVILKPRGFTLGKRGEVGVLYITVFSTF